MKKNLFVLLVFTLGAFFTNACAVNSSTAGGGGGGGDNTPIPDYSGPEIDDYSGLNGFFYVDHASNVLTVSNNQLTIPTSMINTVGVTVIHAVNNDNIQILKDLLHYENGMEVKQFLFKADKMIQQGNAYIGPDPSLTIEIGMEIANNEIKEDPTSYTLRFAVYSKDDPSAGYHITFHFAN